MNVLDIFFHVCYNKTDMNPRTIEQLETLGLQTNEAKIYLALVELGRGTVTEVSKMASLNRTTGYDILERICLYGLANRASLGTKKRLYVAESPKQLKNFLQNKKRMAERRLENVDAILPDLQALFHTDLKPSISFAEGREAIERIYEEQLEAKNTIYSILELKGYSEHYDELGQQMSLDRYRRGIKEKVLARKNDVAVAWWKKIYGKKKKRQEFTEYRWTPETKKYSPAAEILIFDDTVIGLLVKPSENMAFKVQSQSFADSLKMVFELAWEQAEVLKLR